MSVIRTVVLNLMALLLTALGAAMVLSAPLTASSITYFQTETVYFVKADNVDSAARAPPLAEANVAITGGVAVRHGSAFAVHGQETVAALVGFGVDLNAPNTAGGERLLWGSWNDYPKVTRTGPTGPQEYAQIGDRLYSQHAVARMQPSGQRYDSALREGTPPPLVGNSAPYVGEPGFQYFDGRNFIRGRSISPNHVEDILQNTTPTTSGPNLSYRSGDVEVITSQQGRVISIITD